MDELITKYVEDHLIVMYAPELKYMSLEEGIDFTKFHSMIIAKFYTAYHRQLMEIPIFSTTFENELLLVEAGLRNAVY